MRRISCFVFVVLLAATVLPAAAQTLIANVDVQNDAFYLAANPVTGMVYVVNTCGTDPSCGNNSPATVTVINGATNTVVTTINVGVRAEFLVINPVTNQIYVTNRHDNTVSVIDGNTNTVTATIPVGANPTVEDVNPVTNTIYVVNNGNGTGTTMSVINGSTNTVTTTVTVGNYPLAVAVNSVTNMVYVVNYCGNQPGCNSTPAPGTVSVIDGSSNTVTNTITVGYGAGIILVNPVTNQVWVQNSCGSTPSCDVNGNTNVIGSVTLIDGATGNTQTASVGQGSAAMAVNNVANQAYTTNSTDNTATIVNVTSGGTLTTQTLNVGISPADIEVNPVTDFVYVCNSGDNTVTAFNGATGSVYGTVTVGNTPVEAWVNPIINRTYVSNVGGNTVSVLTGVPPNAVQFVPATPCRLVDTRTANGGSGPIPGGTSQSFPLPQLGNCNIPNSAAAYSLNVTVVPPAPLGFLTIWPTGERQPTVSTMNSLDGRIKANAAIVPAGYQGAVSVFVSNTTDVVIDINGYFTLPTSDPARGRQPGESTSQFYPVTPCRVIDTRGPASPLGAPSLTGGTERDFPVLESTCIPTGPNIQAYSFNFTVVPNPAGTALGYLSVWPTGETQPVVSTLNNLTATTVANAGIVPAGSGGSISVVASNNTDLVVDIDGYFAPAGTGGLSLYTVAPCRVIDTRGSGNGFVNEMTVNVVNSACQPPSNAQAYVFNATVVPPTPLGYLSLWPDGQNQPVVSTLNALDGAITSNMAIVPTTNGSIDAFASNLTQLILDISGYYAPEPVR